MQQLQRATCQHQQLLALTLVLVLAHSVAADVKQLSSAVLGEQPLWMRNRSADIVLNFQQADPHYKHPSLGVVAVRGKPMKVNFHIGYYHGNVAIVRFGSRFVLAVRKMHFYKTLRSDLEGYPLSDKKGGCGGCVQEGACVRRQRRCRRASGWLRCASSS